MIKIEDLKFTFSGTAFRLNIEKLSVAERETVAFIGPSGSGKTTLLHLLSGICSPDSGKILISDKDLSTINESLRRDFRISQIGLAFQEFELLEHLTVLDNVLLPYRISSSLKLSKDVEERGRELLNNVGMEDKKKRSVGKLSQGERQRVAVCRALITEPKLVLADEPTGNLDPANKQIAIDLLLENAKSRKSTLITVTHDHSLLDGFDRIINFADFHTSTEVKQ